MSLRLRAALVVIVLVAGQFAALLHSAAAVHATCPEHGEPIHVVDGIASADEAPRVPEILASNALETSAHEHCKLAGNRRETRDSPRPAAALASTEFVVADRNTGDEHAPAIAVLRVSPKQSPPDRAA